MKLKVTVNGIPYDIEVEVEERDKGTLDAIVIGGGAAPPAPARASVQGAPSNAVVAPLSGTVTRVLVEEGDKIAEGDVLLVLEAMKMETEITAPWDGTIGRVLVEKGDTVGGGEALIEFGECCDQ